MNKNGDRELGLWMCMALVVGNMIGSGVFFLPSALAEFGGISILGWLFSAAGALALAFVFSNLSRRVSKKSGGPYVYAREGLGEFAAFLVAWGYWVSIWCANAGIAVAFVGYLSVFVPVLATNVVMSVLAGLGAIWVLTWVNTRGLKQAGKVQLFTTVLKLIPLGVVAFGGLWFIDPEHLTPFNRSEGSNFSAITATATLTLYAFLGMESATIPAAEVKDPERTIPKATIYGTLVVIVVYVLGTTAVLGIIPPEVLEKSNAPFADAAAVAWGETARYLVAAGVVISTFGALNGWILLQGQIPAAAAKDALFPRIFGRENSRSAPAAGLVITSTLVSILRIMNYTRGLVEAFRFMILLATLTVLVPYLFSAATFALLSLQDRFWPDRKLVGKLALAIAAFGYSMWAVAGSGEETVYWGFMLLMAGIPFYVWIKAGNTTK